MLRMRETVLWVTLAAIVAPCLWTATARAQGGAEGTNVVASALALPIDVNGVGRATEIVITNAGPARTLHVTLIDDDWLAWDFSCYVTRNETTLFEFEYDPASDPDDPTALLSHECTDSFSQNPNDPVVFDDVPFAIDQGIMLVTLEDHCEVDTDDNPETPPEEGSCTVSSDQIFGDATVIDFDRGLAYSFDAIGFGAGSEQDGDRQYEFDGSDYTAFPARLATNFLAPTESPPPSGEEEISASLILFTLDGTIGSGSPPHAHLGVNFYNDDELRRSATHQFDGFDIISLVDPDPSDAIDDGIDQRFLRNALGSDSGHLVLTPQSTLPGDAAHDSQFGDADDLRKTPVHGWLVQEAIEGTRIGTNTLYLASDPGWGRPLAASKATLVPVGNDVPTLNAVSCDAIPCLE